MSWVDFWSFWGFLGGLLEVLEGLGRLLGHLGGSWSLPERSWGHLGPSFAFRVIKKPTRKSAAPHLEASRGGKMRQKSDLRGTKIGQKSMIKTKSKKEALEDRLGAVLG